MCVTTQQFSMAIKCKWMAAPGRKFRNEEINFNPISMWRWRWQWHLCCEWFTIWYLVLYWSYSSIKSNWIMIVFHVYACATVPVSVYKKYISSFDASEFEFGISNCTSMNWTLSSRIWFCYVYQCTHHSRPIKKWFSIHQIKEEKKNMLYLRPLLYECICLSVLV